MAASFPSPRAQELFLKVRGVPAGRRSAWLGETCGDDADLRASVEDLLAGDEAGPALEPPSPETVASWYGPRALPEVSGLTVGSCRLVRLLAEGGMGRVYEAVQEPPGRRVAVKLLRQALPDDLARARFEDEARLLATIDHPGVCRVFEVGVWATGGHEAIPYCVMELVEDAKPVTAFAAERGLSTEERVRLMVQVCAAVSASHAKGVLHRDVKPGNVLVDREGRPKVIDFGIARTLDERDRGHGRLTRTGLCLGTPAYMSPEQLLGRPEDVDVRSDVHALGVLLYQTLTGRLPRDLGDGSLGAAVKALREQRPVPPDRLEPRVPRDLGAVCLKAIETESGRRYASVDGFAADLRRWLEGKPVQARPAGVLRAAGLWARRNKTVAALAAVLVVAVSGGVIAAGLSARRERAAREVADGQRDRAETILRRSREFLPWLLTEHQRAIGGLPRSQPVVRALAQGVRDHLRALSYDEVTDPDLLLVAARSYVLLAAVESGMGVDTVDMPRWAAEDADTARRLARRVRDARAGADTAEVDARAEIVLARLAAQPGDYAKALDHLGAADKTLEAAVAKGTSGPLPGLRLECALVRAGILEAKEDLEGSAAAVAEAVRRLDAAEDLAIPPSRVLDLQYRMARSLIRTGRDGDAPPWVERIEKTAAVWEAAGGKVEARTALYRAMVFLADARFVAGRSPIGYFEKAATALGRWREAAPADRQVDREEAALSQRTGAALLAAGRYAEALAPLERASVLAEACLREDPSDPVTWNNRLEALLARAEAERRLDDEEAVARRLAEGEEIVRHVRATFPEAKEAWVARCRMVLARAALDTVAGEAERDPVKRRALLEGAIARTAEGGALYREAISHGLPQEIGARHARLCDEAVERLRKEIAQIGTR